MDTKSKYPFLDKLPYILLIGGILGFLASFILTLDSFRILQDPSYSPACNINPILSCGSVMATDQASALGFKNSLIGIAAFAALITISLVLLGGARIKRWLWLAMQVIVTLALIFVHWLMYQTLYNIGSLCPYCIVIWIVTIPLFWYITLYNLTGSKWSQTKAGVFVYKHHGDILFVWFLIIIGLILNRFWYYWSTLL